MAKMENISDEMIQQALADAVAKSLPLTVTVQRQNRWLTFRSRIIVTQQGVMWIDLPTSDNGARVMSYEANEEMGLMFRFGAIRYVFSGSAVGEENYTDEAKHEKHAIRVALSGTMRRSERRLHQREDVPAKLQARASFWLGGREAEPQEARVDAPVWSGRVMDLSAGGILVRASGEASGYIEPGDIVGICITFGGEGQAAYLDAQSRHHGADGEMAMLGFQFVDLETDYAGEAIALIREKLGIGQ